MKNILLATLLLLPTLQVTAQDQEGEVIVIAELSRAEVDQFIEEAEEQFYAIFNANIDNDDYKITCRQETPTGSNIPIRVCEPAFMVEARADNANTFGFNAGVVVTDQALRAGLEPEYKRLQEAMEKMTRDNAQFAQIAGILTQLRARRQQLMGE